MNRLKISVLLVILVFSLNCSAQNRQICKDLSLTDAEKILGQSSQLVEAITENKEDSHILKCKYSTTSKDKATGQEINLYFMIEESASDEQAKRIYKEIRDSNKNHAGIEIMNGIGDEAYAHSEKPNFHFVLVRKGRFTIRMKVNKAVATTSLEELKNFAKKIVGEI